MANVIEQLQLLGFSQYEAQAYVSLLRESPLNGYELARQSGIPRPNIYSVLQKLEERGAILRLDSPEGTRYTPLAPEELMLKLNKQYQSTVEAVSCTLAEISAPASVEPVLNVRGYQVLLDHAIALLDSAQKNVLISLWPAEAVALAATIQAAKARGVQITTLCLRGCPKPCPYCQGSVFRFPLSPVERDRWLVVIQDDRELLAGGISPDQDTLAVRTRQKMLVDLAASYVQNSIALANLLYGLGDRVTTVLEPSILASLDALHPINSQGRWLDVMQHIIHSEGNLQ